METMGRGCYCNRFAPGGKEVCYSEGLGYDLSHQVLSAHWIIIRRQNLGIKHLRQFAWSCTQTSYSKSDEWSTKIVGTKGRLKRDVGSRFGKDTNSASL